MPFDFYEGMGLAYGIGRADGATGVSGTSGGGDVGKGEFRMLSDRVERLAMACEALWVLLKEKTGLSDDALMAEMSRLDLADGRMDGKSKKGPIECGACGKMNARRHRSCLYCNALLERSAFD